MSALRPRRGNWARPATPQSGCLIEIRAGKRLCARGVPSWHAGCFGPLMRNPLLLTSAIACFALTACGGSNESAKSANNAEKANDAAEKAEDKADKAADKANDAASDANKAENENAK